MKILINKSALLTFVLKYVKLHNNVLFKSKRQSPIINKK